MKTYEPNESPAIKDVEIGKPIFYTKRMMWIIPTKTRESEMVWWSKDGTEIWNSLENFTYNPVVPEKPKLKQTLRFYLWLYPTRGEYVAHQYPPDGDTDAIVVAEFEHEVME